jgi:hypothetical protein
MKKDQSKDKDGAVRIESLKQLQERCEQPVICRFRLDDQELEVPCRRLTPKLQEQVREVLREAVPKWKADRKDYDALDPDYLAKRDRNAKVARALVIYNGCPLVAQARPGLLDRMTIYEYVQGLFAENILEMLALTIESGGLELMERANFTSTAGLEN